MSHETTLIRVFGKIITDHSWYCHLFDYQILSTCASREGSSCILSCGSEDALYYSRKNSRSEKVNGIVLNCVSLSGAKRSPSSALLTRRDVNVRRFGERIGLDLIRSATGSSWTTSSPGMFAGRLPEVASYIVSHS